MLKKLFDGNAKSITSAAVIIGAASLISRLLGFLRDRVLAGEFGAGETLDVYYAAFRIPDFIFNLLILGALSAGFIPVFTSFLKRDALGALVGYHRQESAWELVSNLMNVFVVALLVIFGILYFTAPFIMTLLTPGFSEIQRAQSITLTRIMFLSPLFLGISSIFGGVLQSFKRFFVYSLAPIFYNIGIIVGALYFTKFWGIYGLAWGVVFGAFMHMLVQIPSSVFLGYRYRPVLNIFEKGLRKILMIMVPRTLSLAVSQINLFIVVILGSMLKDGSIAIFNFAMNIQSFPLGIFAISFAIAAFPTLSEYAFDRKKFVENFISTLNQILFFMIPSSALLIVLRAQIVRVVLGASPLFDWADTIDTLDMLALFSISLFAQGLIPLFARGFFAQHNSKTPFLTGLISAVVNVFLSVIFVPFLGVHGLALSFSVSNILQLMLLWLILHRRYKTLGEIHMLKSVAKISIASFLMVIMVQITKVASAAMFGTDTFFGVFIQGLSAALAGIIVYITVCLAFRLHEALIFMDSFRKKFIKRFRPVEVIQE